MAFCWFWFDFNFNLWLKIESNFIIYLYSSTTKLNSQVETLASPLSDGVAKSNTTCLFKQRHEQNERHSWCDKWSDSQLYPHTSLNLVTNY